MLVSTTYKESCGFNFLFQTLIVIETLGMDRLASAIGFYAIALGVSSGVSFPIGGRSFCLCFCDIHSLFNLYFGLNIKLNRIPFMDI